MSPIEQECVNTSTPERTLSNSATAFGTMIARAHGEKDESPLALWSALLYAHLHEGRVYLDITKPFDGLEAMPHPMPPLDPAPAWLHVVSPGQPTPIIKPLVCCGNQLWFARYYDFDGRLRQMLDTRRSCCSRLLDESKLTEDIKQLFPLGANAESDRGQLLAAANLVDLSFGLLTGGPGTGKTTSLAKMLLLHLHQGNESEIQPILLLAPTGKAATRLKNGLTDAINGRNKLRSSLPKDGPLYTLLDYLDPQKETCLVKTQTIHRALGVRTSRREGQGPFWRDRNNPLQASFVIVDEVSMVDLALMARLVEAVPPDIPLILVGDAEQLESVEAGSVLPEIAQEQMAMPAERKRLISNRTGVVENKLEENVRGTGHVRLTYNHRFTKGSVIGKLADAVNQAKADDFIKLIEDAATQNVRWLKLPEDGRQQPACAKEAMMEGYQALHDLLKAEGPLPPAAAVNAFDQFRVLCAIRKGPDGVESWNKRLQEWVVGNLRDSKPRAVMVTINDTASQLCNGDTGLVLPAPDKVNRFYLDGETQWPASLLPDNEPGWAITIHKSQGSEYNHVAIVLPRKGGEALLTRRLLYTALTRAREKVIILATEKALRTAIG